MEMYRKRALCGTVDRFNNFEFFEIRRKFHWQLTIIAHTYTRHHHTCVACQYSNHTVNSCSVKHFYALRSEIHTPQTSTFAFKVASKQSKRNKSVDELYGRKIRWQKMSKTEIIIPTQTKSNVRMQCAMESYQSVALAAHVQVFASADTRMRRARAFDKWKWLCAL